MFPNHTTFVVYEKSRISQGEPSACVFRNSGAQKRGEHTYHAAYILLIRVSDGLYGLL